MKEHQNQKPIRPMTLKGSFAVLAVVVFCIAGSALLKTSMFYGFAIANGLLLFYFSSHGYEKRDLIQAAGKAIYSCRIVYMVIFLMGASIASWLASGVIPAIIFHGMALFSPKTFLLFAFWICLLVAMIMGTALGTISTVGIALMGIGQGFGLPAPMVLGAIISGAYVSDKLSPISGLVNMNLGISEIDYKDFFKRSLQTFIPVFLVTSLVYGIMGMFLGTGSEPGQAELLKEALKGQFGLTPLLFMMPALLIGLTMYGVKIHKSMSLCIVMGAVIAVVYQGFSPVEMGQFLLYGFKLDAGSGLLESLLKGGGIMPMMEVLLIVACAVAFAGMIERTDALKPFMTAVISPKDGIGKTQMKTGLLSILFLSIACDQSLAIILPVKSLREHYAALGMDQIELSRVVFDTGVMLAPLQFWNVNTIIITAMTGLGAGAYGPYAVLIWLFPLVATAYGYLREWHLRRNVNEQF